MQDHDWARRISKTCEECGAEWLWPWPKYKKHPYSQPTDCPDCRHADITALEKRCDTLLQEHQAKITLLRQIQEEHLAILQQAHEQEIETLRRRIKSLTPHRGESMLRPKANGDHGEAERT